MIEKEKNNMTELEVSNNESFQYKMERKNLIPNKLCLLFHNKLKVVIKFLILSTKHNKTTEYKVKTKRHEQQ